MRAGVTLLFCCLPRGPGESSTRVPSETYNRLAVPEFPDLDRRRRGLPGCPGWVARSSVLNALVAARRPGHPGRVGGTRRPADRGHPPAGASSWLIDLDRDRIVVNPMLTGRFQLGCPRRPSTRRRPPWSPSGFGTADGRPAQGRRRSGPGARSRLPPDSASAEGAATATRRRWARSTSFRRRSTGRSRVSTLGELRPGRRTTPALSLDDLAGRASGVIRVS